MLHCARECSIRDTDNHITFGEFCVFATELRRYYNNHDKDPNTVMSLPQQVSKVDYYTLLHYGEKKHRDTYRLNSRINHQIL